MKKKAKPLSKKAMKRTKGGARPLPYTPSLKVGGETVAVSPVFKNK